MLIICDIDGTLTHTNEVDTRCFLESLRTVVGIDLGEAGPRSDKTHARWQREGSKFSACSDQFFSGIAKGSLYYPRIVTNILWMKEHSFQNGNASNYSNLY